MGDPISVEAGRGVDLAEAMRRVEYDMAHRAMIGSDGFVAERTEVATIINALRAALSNTRDTVRVPREPTLAMLVKGGMALVDTKSLESDAARAEEVWSAMISASTIRDVGEGS